MANRFPLTLNTGSSTIEELPSGDNLDLSGSNISNVANITAGNSVSANYFVGNLYGTANLATYATTANSVAGSNVSGQVSYAAIANSVAGANVTGAVSSATTAGTVTTAAQPNITSTGTLTGLTVNGDTNLGPIANVHITGGSANQLIQTDGAGNLSFATVSGDSYFLKPVVVATVVNITLSGTQTIDGVTVAVGDRVLVWKQTTSTENGVYIVASGSWTRATDFTTGANTLSGGVSVGVINGTQYAGLTFICTNTTAITIGSTAITFGFSFNTGVISIWTGGTGQASKAIGAINSGAVAMGPGANAGTDSVVMGYQASGSGASISVGYQAAAGTNQGTAIGTQSLVSGQGGTAIGRSAYAGANGVGIGFQAGFFGSQGVGHVAIGKQAGYTVQGANTVAIGSMAGYSTQGTSSIAIGANAGYTSQGNNSIILNATGANLNMTTANTFTVKPIRNATGGNVLYYDQSTGEITYSTAPTSTKDYLFAYNAGATVSLASANTSLTMDTVGSNTANVTYNTATGNLLLPTGKVMRLTASGLSYLIPGSASALTSDIIWVYAANNIPVIGGVYSTIKGSDLTSGTSTSQSGGYSLDLVINMGSSANIKLVSRSGMTGVSFTNGQLVVTEL